MRYRLEYFPVRVLAALVGALPRPLARGFCIALGLLVYFGYPRLRHVGRRNLDLAFPSKSRKEKKKILRGVYVNLGRLMAEFCLFPRYTQENVGEVAVYQGFQNFAEAQARGKGVIFLTAHLGGWEVSSFAHSLYGHPMDIVMRPLDNPYVDALVDRYRTRHGNRTFPKQDFARGLLTALRQGETVGILMDTNMTPPQGAFVIWDKHLGKYKICFEPPLDLVRTGDDEADALANTALFTKVIERFVAKYPDQWLWVHRRWKT